MQGGVDGHGGGPGHDGDFWAAFRPELSKEIEAITLALGAGAMSRGQCRGFVKKEQFGVPAGLHDRASAALELEQADDPALSLVGASNLPVIVVQTTSISHQRSPRGGGNQCAKRRDAILSEHAGLD